MTFAEFEAAAKTKLAEAETLIRNLLGVLPPDLQHDAIAAAQDGVGAIGTLATAEVEKVVPAAAQPTVDDIIAAVQAKAESDIAAIQTNTATTVATLQSAKAAVTA